MATRYAIADEPRPSPMSHLAVNPFWPLFAQMLVGSWLALPWFFLNGIALGSVNQRREWLCIAASLAGAVLLAWSTIHFADDFSPTQLRFALLAIVVVKIAMAYALYALQATSFELWEYFGGKARNALLVLVAGFFFKAYAAKSVAMPVLLLLVLS